MWLDDAGQALSEWSTGDAFNEPRTDSTVPTDLVQVRQDVDTSGTGSSWGGFLQGALGKVVDYSLARDAQRTQQQLQQQRAQALSTQPLVTRTGSGVAVNPMGLVLIGGIVLAVVLAARSKG